MALAGHVAATVAQKLAASRDAHLRKKHAAGKIDSLGTVESAPDYPKAEAHILEALTLRLEAHALDPQHEAPAWAEDTAANKGLSDDALLMFFVAYCKPLIPPDQMAQLVARDPLFAKIAYIP